MCYMCVHHVIIWLSSLIIFWGGCHRVYGNIAQRTYRSLCASAYQMFPLSFSPGLSEPQSIIFFSSCFSSCQSLLGWGYKSLAICLGSGYWKDTCMLSCLTHSYRKVIIVGPFRYLKNLPVPKLSPSILGWDAEEIWMVMFALTMGRSRRKSFTLQFFVTSSNTLWHWADSDLEQ